MYWFFTSTVMPRRRRRMMMIIIIIMWPAILSWRMYKRSLIWYSGYRSRMGRVFIVNVTANWRKLCWWSYYPTILIHRIINVIGLIICISWMFIWRIIIRWWHVSILWRIVRMIGNTARYRLYVRSWAFSSSRRHVDVLLKKIVLLNRFTNSISIHLHCSFLSKMNTIQSFTQ